MDKEVVRVEKIERYLKNMLQGEELQHFERQLKYDPILENQIELQRAIMETVEIYGDQEIIKSLDKYHDEFVNEK